MKTNYSSAEEWKFLHDDVFTNLEAITESMLRIKDMEIAKNEAGEEISLITTKGYTRSAVIMLNTLVILADTEMRDFAPHEVNLILSFCNTLQENIKKRSNNSAS